MKFLDRLFPQPSLADLLAEQLVDADRLRAVHLAAAEHHAALAGMYAGRAQRIRREQAPVEPLRAVK